MNVWVVFLLLWRNSRYVRHLTFTIWVDITFLQLANDLRDSDLLKELHTRLAKIQNLTQQVADKVDDVHGVPGGGRSEGTRLNSSHRR